MRVAFHQQKNGLLAFFWRVMKSLAAARVSSSIVSIRFLVSGPVSSIVCPPLPSALHLMHAARAELLAERLAVGEHHVARIVAVLRFLFGVQVIEVAEEFVEAMHRRQVLVPIALVILAKLAGRVALAFQHGRPS